MNKKILDQKDTKYKKGVVKFNVIKRVFLVGQAIYRMKRLQTYIHIALAWIYSMKSDQSSSAAITLTVLAILDEECTVLANTF